MDKTCTKCGKCKPRSEFSVDNANKDGLSYRCRGCCAEYVASPKGREADRKYNAKPERREARRKYEAKPERREARRKADRKRNGSPKRRASMRNARQRRRARMLGVKNTLADAEINAQREKQGCECEYGDGTDCKGSMHMDHVVPLTPRPGELQGTHTADNIVFACGHHNSRKSNKQPEVWYAEIGREPKFWNPEAYKGEKV